MGEEDIVLDPIPATVFENRWETLHRWMHTSGIDALVATALPHVRWLTEYAPPLGVSADRSWIVVLPKGSAPELVVPSVVANDLDRAKVASISTWDSPDPAVMHDGLSTVQEVFARSTNGPLRLGFDHGPGARPTVSSPWVAVLKQEHEVVDATAPLLHGRRIKAPSEVGRISAAARASCRAFEALADPPLSSGCDECGLHRHFLALVPAMGAEVGYLTAGSGSAGYKSLTRPPTARVPDPGDVVTLDLGARIDGYWSDLNRNGSVGPPLDTVLADHALLCDAIAAGVAASRPGVPIRDVHAAMLAVLGERAPASGRMGHGVGLDFTEGPSIHPRDQTVLAPGMVLAIEPSIMVERSDGSPALMAAEDMIEVTDTVARYLSVPTSSQVPVWID